MPVILHGILPSPPCRAVLMTAKAIGLDIELKPVNIMAGENRTSEFVEMNPQHTIPLLDDEGFMIPESRAIMTYLMDQHGPEDDPLYPKDNQKRALILSRMMFDQGTLYGRLADYYFPQIFKGKEADESKLEPLNDALDILDKYLDGNDWVAGENMTIADIAIAVSVSQGQMLGVDLENLPNISRWLETCKSEIPGYDEINEEGIAMFRALVGK